jgi:hypothetical protein
MNYPNRVIKKGETDKAIVEAIQAKLNEKNCGPIGVDGDFGNNTISAVKLFQTRNTDTTGASLVADGQIGSVTWAALFGADAVVNNNAAPSALLTHALISSISQINVVEQPAGSNRGPEVDAYLRAAGLDPTEGHYSWCAAFVYWNFKQAATQLGIPNPLVKTAGVLDHWARAKCTKITQASALNDPSQIIPGSIFIIDHGHNLGHTGIVESVNGGNLTTIEGNTNPGLSREGYGVFRLTRRRISDITKGFLNY